jgi:hypothetical protein
LVDGAPAHPLDDEGAQALAGGADWTCLLGGVTRFGFIASPLRLQQLLPPLKDASKTLR